MNKNEKTGAGGCRGGSERIARFVERELLPHAGGGSDAMSVFRRMARVFESVVALDGAEYYESAASLAATLFERYMDLRLLTGEQSEAMMTRHREFMEIQKFRAAHRIVSFHEESGAETALDAAAHKKFKEDTGGLEGIRRKVIEVWGADNQGRGSYPVHWSGRKCTRQISRDMGVDYEQLYIEAYSMLSWMIHNGMSGGGEPGEELKNEIFQWCHGVSQLVMLEAAGLCLGLTGRERKEYPWLARAVEYLRISPGAALVPEWFDTAD